MTTIRFPGRSGARKPGVRRGTAAPRDPAALPFWLRRRPNRPALVALGPRDLRWWVGVLLLSVSVLLLCFVGHVTLFGALQESRSQTALYEQLRSELANGTAPIGPTDVNDKVVPDGSPIALLQIPSLDVNQVIVQGTASDDLRLGPGHRRDTPMPGQVGTSVVFGRQTAYGAPFRDLGRLRPGDSLQVITGQGASVFTVKDVRMPGDPLPIAATTTESRIQLVSAAGPALAPDSVVYVDAVRTRAGKPAASPIIATAALASGENAMQTAPGSLLPFLFAAQWLLVASAATLYLSRRWGRRQAWIVGLPVLVVLGALTADAAIAFLPNLV